MGALSAATLPFSFFNDRFYLSFKAVTNIPSQLGSTLLEAQFLSFTSAADDGLEFFAL